MKLRKRKKKIRKIVIICLVIFLLLAFGIYESKKNYQAQVLGKIYFNKPVSWDCVYGYICDEENEVSKEPIGIELKKEVDYIYSFEITNKMIPSKSDINNLNIIFRSNNNESAIYEIQDEFVGFDKIYNLTQGIGEKNQITIGEWLDYDEDIKIGKIPTTESKIKNVIYMIGDGMGENHIVSGSIYKGEMLNMQTINDKCYVTTSSLQTVTDSAAAATALATGYKTINETIGKDKEGKNLENLIEYSNFKGLKTGIVCTQILNHATPAAFSVHSQYRYNYDEIAISQIESSVDLLLGGGRKYFELNKSLINEKCKWINKLSELEGVSKNERVIGTLANTSMSQERERISLSQMTKTAINRLENENGFFLMIEGSDIDTYSHEADIENMITELIDFDDAVKIAIEYVDKHPDTLLIVTADHETGGLIQNSEQSKGELTDFLFTSNGEHTNANVILYAYGIGANELTQYDIIDNTSIHRFVKTGLSN